MKNVLDIDCPECAVPPQAEHDELCWCGAVDEAAFYRDESERLKAEVREAREEASAVRRAYLHERGRAEAAIRVLRQNGYGTEADALVRRAYKGPAERICAR